MTNIKLLISNINSFFNQGHERTIKAKKNIAYSIVIKGGSITTQLVLVPLTINYINPTQYGIWLTLSTMIAWFSFFDIGFGNGLRNRFAEAKAKNNFKLVKKYVSTTYATLIIIFVAIWIFFLIINPYIEWTKILNAPETLESELKIVMLLVFSFFCLQMVFKTINTILLADQQPAKSALIDMIGQLMALLIIFVLTILTKGSLVYVGVALSLSPVLILIVFSLYYFKNKYYIVAPSINYIDFSITKDILGIGLKFFFIQIAVIILYQTNNIIIAQVCSPKDVTIFNISYKYMNIAVMIFTILISPFWSAFTEAFIVKDYTWMKFTAKKLKLLGFLAIFGTLIMALSAKYGYKLWIGDAVHIPEEITYTMGIYITIHLWILLYTSILNGIGKIRLQLITYSVATIFHVPLAVHLGRLYGVQGIIISASLFCAIIAFFSFVQVNKILNRSEYGIWAK